MSQIAHALAKAKERTGHTSNPFLGSGAAIPAPGTERAAALRRARHRQRFWIILAVVTLPLTAFIFWTQFKAVAAPPPVVEPSSVPATSSAPAAVNASASTQGLEPSVGHAPATASAIKNTQRVELLQLVNNLAISAVMPGDPARIMLAGRVVRAGQPIDGGLVFAGIADGELRFTDANGVAYTRHY